MDNLMLILEKSQDFEIKIDIIRYLRLLFCQVFSQKKELKTWYLDFLNKSIGEKFEKSIKDEFNYIQD